MGLQLDAPEHEATKKTIKNYKLQITVFKAADEEYLRQLFLRLQWGLLLNTEKDFMRLLVR